MKHAGVLLILIVLPLVGCEYESPLNKEHNIPIDSTVLGLWGKIPNEGKEPKQDERIMILKYSTTEYLINYPVGKNGWYFRGYAIEIGGVSCVQLQVIGTEHGPPDEDEKELFGVISYQLTDNELEIKILSTDLVDDDLKTTKGLMQAFLKHKDHKDLFTNPGVFRRIKD